MGKRGLTRLKKQLAGQKRAVLYVRYSSYMQEQGWTKEAQLTALRAYCQEKDWQVVGEFIDEARSGKNDRRPQFQAMIALAEDNGCDVVLVHKLDRFAPNIVDAFRYFHLLKENGVEFVSLTENMDFTGPWGKLVLGVLCLIAEVFLDNLAQETAKGKRQRYLEGHWNGQLPTLGYSTGGKDVRGAPLPAVAIDDELAVWRDAANLYDPCPSEPRVESRSEARTFTEVAAWLNTTLFRPQNRWQGKYNPHSLWLRDTVAHMLQDYFFAGYVEYDGEILPGKHQAATTKEQIDRIRAKARRNYTEHTPHQVHAHLANGFVLCAGCHHPLNAVGTKKASVRYVCHTHLRGGVCSAQKKSTREDDLASAVDQLLHLADVPPQHARHRLKVVQARTVRPSPAKIEESIRRLTVSYRAGALDDDAYMDEMARLRKLLDEATVQTPTRSAAPRFLGEAFRSAIASWRDLAMREKRTFLQSVVASLVYDLDADALVAFTPSPDAELAGLWNEVELPPDGLRSEAQYKPRGRSFSGSVLVKGSFGGSDGGPYPIAYIGEPEELDALVPAA
jgi:DNA invertase Pin-like site-specific DNA recombinase